ncbi:S8 family serine peptidase [Phenylobacterium montanum]|uniref:Zf-HC2 domain-containing protein n=1 Tax=Phenylobacterium montanum TaxID=2823693 RepID=A0A975IYI2_9CAUL|nr:zf-HC2 domain-containing protein [Caulobacter sp. S6]QUD90481.1 zf-HC2 domain-containing protein [Caulobacter sp. S6]
MGNVIRLHDEEHERVQLLLPWFVTSSLEPAEQALAEAHIAGCAECQADLALERRLCAAVADLPIEAEAPAWTPAPTAAPPRRSAVGWRGLNVRGFGGRRLGGGVALTGPGIRAAAPWLGWALAGPALAALTLVLVTPPRNPEARYHTLSAQATAPTAGNVVVIFRPDAREQDLRAALKAGGARLVDGPTAADAYVLHVAATDRSAAIARLRRQPSVELAEPIDSSGPP